MNVENDEPYVCNRCKEEISGARVFIGSFRGEPIYEHPKCHEADIKQLVEAWTLYTHKKEPA